MYDGLNFPELANADDLELEQEQEKRLAEEKEINDLLIDASMDFPEVSYLLQHEPSNTKFMPTCNIHITTGKAKTGKTTSNCIIIASILGHGEQFGIKSLIPNASVLYIDTEQDKADQVRVLRYINKICGKPEKYVSSRLIALHCADTDSNDILTKAEKATQIYNPTLLYIDGIRDCVIDINNIEQVANVMQHLKHIKEQNNCAILCVIHTNKDEADNNPRGHLGTELVNKMSDGFIVTKDGEVFVMHHFASRHLNIPDIKFIRDREENGMPKPYNGLAGQEKKEDEELQKIANTVLSTLKNINEKIGTTNLKKSVAKQLGISQRQLEDTIYWQKIINKIDDPNFKTEKVGNSTLYSYNNLIADEE